MPRPTIRLPAATGRLVSLLLLAALPAAAHAQATWAQPAAPAAPASITAATATAQLAPAPVDPAQPDAATAEGWRQREQNLVRYIRQRFAVPEHKALTIVSEAYRNAIRQHTKPELILAVIAVESTFKERARNGGAMGLMQIIPRYHRAQIAAIGGTRQLYSPAKNIQVGSGILAEYLQKSGGDLRQALMRYKGNFDRIGAGYARKILSTYDRMLQVNDDSINVEE